MVNYISPLKRARKHPRFLQKDTKGLGFLARLSVWGLGLYSVQSLGFRAFGGSWFSEGVAKLGPSLHGKVVCMPHTELHRSLVSLKTKTCMS